MKSMKYVYDHTKIFIAVLYNVMPRRQLAIASNISNTIYCMHKSNVKFMYTVSIYMVVIKTHGSESRGQEEAACTRVFWPTRPLQ